MLKIAEKQNETRRVQGETIYPEGEGVLVGAQLLYPDNFYSSVYYRQSDVDHDGQPSTRPG